MQQYLPGSGIADTATPNKCLGTIEAPSQPCAAARAANAEPLPGA